MFLRQPRPLSQGCHKDGEGDREQSDEDDRLPVHGLRIARKDGRIVNNVLVSPYSSLLPALGNLLEESGGIALSARKLPERELKPDGSIVTNGDRLVEQFLRVGLSKLVPGSTVWGEEQGFSEEGANGLWLVDPIDGTSNYAFGSPLWGISVAFMQGAKLELGGVFLPDLNELYLSAAGGGVTLNRMRLAEIPAGTVRAEELVSYGDRVLQRHPAKAIPGKMRHAGAFVIDGCFVAAQRYRGLIGLREKLYDVAACVLFGFELGADVRYADGCPLNLAALKADVKIAKPWIIFPTGSGFRLDD